MRRALWIALLIGCGRPTPTPTASPPPPVPPHGAEHLERGIAAVTAVVAGDSASRAASAAWLTGAPLPDDSPAAQALREAAKALGAADSAESGAAAVVAVALACAGCHGDRTVQVSAPDRPGKEPGVRAHMARHAWGLDRLWQGLALRDEDAWSAGLTALAEGSLEAEAVPGRPLELGEVQQESDLHALAAQGLLQTDRGERASTVATMIRGCAACHDSTGGGPTPAQ